MALESTSGGHDGSPSKNRARRDIHSHSHEPLEHHMECTGADPDAPNSPVTPLPPLDLPLCDLDTFAKQYQRYAHCIVTVYQIMRDLHIKQELVDMRLVDASKWGRSEYFIQGRTRIGGKMRLLAPFYLDAEIDLPWVVQLAKACEAQDQDLYLCIHTPESVIYEMVTTALP
jgi:hypothetical protein